MKKAIQISEAVIRAAVALKKKYRELTYNIFPQAIEIVSDWDDKEIYGDLHPYTPEGAAKFREYCEVNSIYYYSAPAEQFSIEEALIGARLDRKRKLYLDNMS